MRILQVRQVDFNKKKYITSEIEMHRSLNKHGHITELWGIGDNNKKSEKFVRLFSAPFDRASLFQLKMMFYLPFYAKKNEIEVIIVDDMSVISTLLLLLIRKFNKILIYMDIRTIPVEKVKKSRSKRFKYSCIFASKYFDGSTFITKGTKELVEKKFKISFKNSAIWSSGVNTDIFSPTNIDIEIINTYKKSTKDKFVVFYHGSISQNRGLKLVIDSINRIKEDIPNILFISLSSNNDIIKDYCKKNKINITKHLLLLSAVNNKLVPSFISLADICIVPLPRITWWEVSSPLKLMEYLAMGKPLILSDIKAHLDVVSRKENFCVYFNPDEGISLDNAIKYSFQKMSDFKQYRSSEVDLVRENYTWDVQAKTLEKIFLRGINEK